MSSDQQANAGEGLTRRKFIQDTGKIGVTMAAGTALAFFGGKAPVFAQTRTLHVLAPVSFVSDADEENRRQGHEFEQATGVKLTQEYININDVTSRATAAIEGGTGPDIIQFRYNAPHVYAPGLEDHNDLVTKLGVDKFYDDLKQACLVDGIYRGVPYYSIGNLMTYRTDIFQQLGIQPFPDTWQTFLEAGTKLKQSGMPVGQTLGHTIGDAPIFAYTVLWSFGGKEVDEQGKVAINSQETATAVEYVKELWKAACDEGGLAWDDASNNRAFLAETISVTLNAASIYFVARQKLPDLAEKTDHALCPSGPSGRFHINAAFTHCITRYSQNKDAAKDYLRFIMQKEHYEKWFVLNKGFALPPSPAWKDHPMWFSDPKITIFREIPAYGRNFGYAGPYNRETSEVQAKYIIVDLFARAVKGDSTQSAITWAERELKNVYERA